MKSRIFALLTFALTSCGSYDRLITTEFEPTQANQFRYKATADAASPLASVEAERIRMQWLEQYLKENNVCPTGYVVDERKPVLKSKGLLGDIYDIFYVGKCTP